MASGLESSGFTLWFERLKLYMVIFVVVCAFQIEFFHSFEFWPYGHFIEVLVHFHKMLVRFNKTAIMVRLKKNAPAFAIHIIKLCKQAPSLATSAETVGMPNASSAPQLVHLMLP